VFSSDLPGVNPITLNGMILYYRLMTKWSVLGDNTELSRMGLSQSSWPSGGVRVGNHGVAGGGPRVEEDNSMVLLCARVKGPVA
jgi:hypothetical protein